jgi:hypothetical protein
MKPHRWNARLAAANRVEDVLLVVHQYLAQLPADVMEQLPADCRPGRMDTPEEVADFAIRLVHLECKSDASTSLAIASVASLFASAAQRLASVVRFRDNLLAARETQ